MVIQMLGGTHRTGQMQALTAESGRVKLRVVEAPVPALNEAIVEVSAVSINRGETYQLERPRPGWRPGKDLAGIVTAPAVDGFGPACGERVVAHVDSGGWAQRVAVPTDRLAVIPSTVSDVTAAALPLAGLTALRLLRVTGPLPSRRILLTGASGGVGHYFVELAAAHGALVTAVSTSAAERLTELGATRVVPTVDDADGQFEIAIDSVGGTSLRTTWHKLEQHGTLVWLGQASRTPPALDYFDWEGALSVTIRKFNYMDSTHTVAQDLATLVRLVNGQRLHPEIGLETDWANASEAMDALLARKVRGNVVLTIPQQ